jgi:hypothetical protein
MTKCLMHIACWVRKATNTHTKLCNTHSFSTTTMVVQTRLNFTLYLHCLYCCYKLSLLLSVAIYICSLHVWWVMNVHCILWYEYYNTLDCDRSPRHRFFLVSLCLKANAEVVPKTPNCYCMLLMYVYPPGLNFLDPYFTFMYMHNNHCHRATDHLQLNK